MDLYLLSLSLGGLGLGAMAVSGVSHHGGGHGTSHGHGGHAHGAHAANGAVQGHGHAVGHAHPGTTHHAHDALAHSGRSTSSALWGLASPRVLFSFLVGFGATGLLAHTLTTGALLLALAIAGGIAFERLAVTPIWNFFFRFASTPASMLESTVLDEARAASGFDARGQGLVAIELDGQVVQLLGTLRPEDRDAGIRVRAGDRLRVEEVDGARNQCIVSYLGR